jgi:hypothetical protein
MKSLGSLIIFLWLVTLSFVQNDEILGYSSCKDVSNELISTLQFQLLKGDLHVEEVNQWGTANDDKFSQEFFGNTVNFTYYDRDASMFSYGFNTKDLSLFLSGSTNEFSGHYATSFVLHGEDPESAEFQPIVQIQCTREKANIIGYLKCFDGNSKKLMHKLKFEKFSVTYVTLDSDEGETNLSKLAEEHDGSRGPFRSTGKYVIKNYGPLSSGRYKINVSDLNSFFAGELEGFSADYINEDITGTKGVFCVRGNTSNLR